MGNNKTKIFPLVVVLAAIVSILFGVAVYKVQLQMHLPLSAATLEHLFGDSSCSLPCWQGITPSLTTSAEALQRLNESSLVAKDSIRSEGTRTGTGKTEWYWEIGGTKTEEGNITWDNGVVYMMELTTYNNVSIGKVINRFGPPEKVEAIDCTDIPEGEHQYLCVTLYFIRNGFEVHFTCEDSWTGNNAQITSSNLIEFIRVFGSLPFEEWGKPWGLDPQDIDLRDWKGYGNLYDLYIR